MFLLGHRDTSKVYPRRWMQMSLSLRISKPVFGENGKKILVVLNWQLTNRPAYFVAAEMSFCVGRDVIEDFALRNKIEEIFKFRDIGRRDVPSEYLKVMQIWVEWVGGRDWICFYENLISRPETF